MSCHVCPITQHVLETPGVTIDRMLVGKLLLVDTGLVAYILFSAEKRHVFSKHAGTELGRHHTNYIL